MRVLGMRRGVAGYELPDLAGGHQPDQSYASDQLIEMCSVSAG